MANKLSLFSLSASVFAAILLGNGYIWKRNNIPEHMLKRTRVEFIPNLIEPEVGRQLQDLVLQLKEYPANTAETKVRVGLDTVARFNQQFKDFCPVLQSTARGNRRGGANRLGRNLLASLPRPIHQPLALHLAPKDRRRPPLPHDRYFQPLSSTPHSKSICRRVYGPEGAV